MKRIVRIGLVALVLLACVGCDRVTKNIARTALASSPVSLLGGSVYFEYSENPGAFWGLGSQLPIQVRFAFLVLFVGVVLAFTVVYVMSSDPTHGVRLAGLSLAAGGGMGNLLDRLINHGSVIDFVVLGIGRLHTGVFNLADVQIIAGMVLLLISASRPEHAPPGGSEPPGG